MAKTTTNRETSDRLTPRQRCLVVEIE